MLERVAEMTLQELKDEIKRLNNSLVVAKLELEVYRAESEKCAEEKKVLLERLQRLEAMTLSFCYAEDIAPGAVPDQNKELQDYIKDQKKIFG